MAPPPEYDKEPKAPDKSATNISTEDSKLLHSLVNDQHSNSDLKSTNTVTAVEVENKKHVETLDDGQLKALLDEAINYKNPKDREGKSKIFKELLEEAEQESDEQACEAAARALSGCRVRRGRRGPALPHSNSLQDLVAALAAEPPRKHHVRHHPPPHAPTPNVSARAIHGGSLPSGVDTSSLSEEPARGAGYLATVRCVNPPPLAERRVSASDANAPAELELLNRRSKPMFPMTYTARATLEIGSGAVCSGRAVTTTTASNQVRTHDPQARLLNALYRTNGTERAASQGKTNTPRGPNDGCKKEVEKSHESPKNVNRNNDPTAEKRDKFSHATIIEIKGSSMMKNRNFTTDKIEMYSTEANAPTGSNPSVKKTNQVTRRSRKSPFSNFNTAYDLKDGEHIVVKTELCLDDPNFVKTYPVKDHTKYPTKPKEEVCSHESNHDIDKSRNLQDLKPITMDKNKCFRASSADMQKIRAVKDKSNIEETKLCSPDATNDIDKTSDVKKDNTTIEKKEICFRKFNTYNNKANYIKDNYILKKTKNTCSFNSIAKNTEISKQVTTNLKDHNFTTQEKSTCSLEPKADNNIPCDPEDRKHSAYNTKIYRASGNNTKTQYDPKQNNPIAEEIQKYSRKCDNTSSYVERNSIDHKRTNNCTGTFPRKPTNIKSTEANHDLSSYSVENVDNWYKTLPNFTDPFNIRRSDNLNTELSKARDQNLNVHVNFSTVNEPNKDTIRQDDMTKTESVLVKEKPILHSQHDFTTESHNLYYIGSQNNEDMLSIENNCDFECSLSNKRKKNKHALVAASLCDSNPRNIRPMSIASPKKIATKHDNIHKKSDDVKNEIRSHDLINYDCYNNNRFQNEYCVSENLNVNNEKCDQKTTDKKNSDVKNEIITSSQDLKNEIGATENDFQNECSVNSEKSVQQTTNPKDKNSDVINNIKSQNENDDKKDIENECSANLYVYENIVQRNTDLENKNSVVQNEISSQSLENEKSVDKNNDFENEVYASENLNIDHEESIQKNIGPINQSNDDKNEISSHDLSNENDDNNNDFQNVCSVSEALNVNNENSVQKNSDLKNENNVNLEVENSFGDNPDLQNEENVEQNTDLHIKSNVQKLLNIDVGNDNGSIDINTYSAELKEVKVNDAPDRRNIAKRMLCIPGCGCGEPRCEEELTELSDRNTLSANTNADIELQEFKSTQKDEKESFAEYVSLQQRVMVDIENVQENTNDNKQDQCYIPIQLENSEHETILFPVTDYDAPNYIETANGALSTISENINLEAFGENQITVVQSGIVLPPEFCDNAYFLLTLPSSNNNIDPFVSETSKTKIGKKKENLSVAPSNTNKKEDVLSKNILKMLLFENLFKNDSNDKSGTTGVSAITDVEVDSAISFSCITTPEVVASCNTTSSSAQSAIAVDPKPQRASPGAFAGLPLARPGPAAAPPAGDDYKKSLDENGNSVQGFSSPLSGSSQHKKPRRKKSSKNETVIDCQQIDGYQGDKDVNELLRFIESNADHGRAPKLPRPKHKDDSDDKSTKKRSAERRKDKESKMKRASSLEELSRTKLEDLTDAPERPDKKERRDHAPAKERRSWGDDTRDVFDADAPAAELTDFQTVTKKRKPRRRADDSERDPPRRARAPSPRRRESAPPSDRSNDSNDDMDSVHSLPDAPRAPPAPPAPQASYADIARTRHNIPDLIESCNFYAEDAPPRRDPAVPGDVDGYPALDRGPRRRDAKPPPPAPLRRDRKERPPPAPEPPPAPDCPAPDVVADRRPPVILLDSDARPRDMDGVTFGFDINETLLGSGGARRPRCDLVRDAVAGVAAAAGAAAAVGGATGAGVAVRAGCLALRYVAPEVPHDEHHLHQIVDYVGSAWEDAVRCGGKARYFSG